MWPPQLWLLAALEFFLRKDSPLKGGETVQPEIGGNSAWGKADLFDGGIGWGAGGGRGPAVCGGLLLSRRRLC